MSKRVTYVCQCPRCSDPHLQQKTMNKNIKQIEYLTIKEKIVRERESIP